MLDVDVRRQDVAALNEGRSEQDMVNIQVSLHWMKVDARRGECPSIRLIVVVHVDSVFRDSFL